MSNYRRAHIPRGAFFFTVKTERNAPIFRNEFAVKILSDVIRETQQLWQFEINAIVLLPDHLHAIQDEEDFQSHFDYTHWNPVKHGYVKCPIDWTHSSFRRWVAKGVYEKNWGCSEQEPDSIIKIKKTSASEHGLHSRPYEVVLFINVHLAAQLIMNQTVIDRSLFSRVGK